MGRGSCLEVVTALILVKDFFATAIKTRCWFPRCFRDRISFPLDIVSISSPSFLVSEDRFYFVSFFVILDVRGGSDIIGSVYVCFHIWHKENCMKDVMNP